MMGLCIRRDTTAVDRLSRAHIQHDPTIPQRV